MASNKSGTLPKAEKAQKKQYMTWLENPDKIKSPQELTLTIRDMAPGRRKYGAINVIAIVSPSPITEGDVLWVRYANGKLIPQPWSIKIIKELDEFFPGRPYAGIVD